ncbi:MAG: indole-3-glycerol phosphate synthase TrpC [Verrucomicrobiia bacterium]
MNFLEKILDRKRAEVAERSRIIPLEELRARPDPRNGRRPFAAALRQPHGLSLIAEIKKASPSAGMIRPNFDPATLAKAYERGGANALSILTDEPFFQGHLDYLRAARAATHLPCLRKDFILSEYQVWEARAAGADAILLIVAALLRRDLIHLLEAARAAELDVIVEVHDERELDASLQVDAPIIGINNRNLKTFKVDVAVTEALAPRVPRDRIVVSESGLSRGEQLQRVRDAGASAVLIGESLMRHENVEEATLALVAKMRA